VLDRVIPSETVCRGEKLKGVETVESDWNLRLNVILQESILAFCEEYFGNHSGRKQKDF